MSSALAKIEPIWGDPTSVPTSAEMHADGQFNCTTILNTSSRSCQYCILLAIIPSSKLTADHTPHSNDQRGTPIVYLMKQWSCSSRDCKPPSMDPFPGNHQKWTAGNCFESWNSSCPCLDYTCPTRCERAKVSLFWRRRRGSGIKLWEEVSNRVLEMARAMERIITFGWFSRNWRCERKSVRVYAVFKSPKENRLMATILPSAYISSWYLPVHSPALAVFDESNSTDCDIIRYPMSNWQAIIGKLVKSRSEGRMID